MKYSLVAYKFGMNRQSVAFHSVCFIFIYQDHFEQNAKKRGGHFFSILIEIISIELIHFLQIHKVSFF